MARNIPKRIAADAWSLETTTMYGPGENSIAEEAHELAQKVARGAIKDSTLLFDHRQASEAWDIAKVDQRRKAIIEASGDAIRWADVKSIAGGIGDDIRNGNENEARRYWLNQPRRSSARWHPVVDLWRSRASKRLPRGFPDHPNWPKPGAEVVLAFDGSYSRDSTVLIGATVAAVPLVFEVKVWERPHGKPKWRTPRLEVDEELAAAMERWNVVELAPDPPGWHREIEDWEQTYGEVVVRFETNNPSRMGPACDDFEQAVSDGEIQHDASEVIDRHLGHATPILRRGYTVITKESPDSPLKIDAAVGAIVAHHRARWHHSNQPEETTDAFFILS
jgi:hypothetical protein